MIKIASNKNYNLKIQMLRVKGEKENQIKKLTTDFSQFESMTIPSGIVGKMMSACHIFSFLASEEGRIVELVVVNHPSLRDNCDVNQFVDVHVDDVN